jgi:3-deoxy-manno-octulosonate cytidylyltransferase (CMP-KDO synthetase)
MVDELVVATDSEQVAAAAERAGVRAVLTHDGHLSGTDRVAEVADRPEFAGYDVVANVQGDEPFVPRDALAGALGRVDQGDEIGTAAAPLALELAADPARVKVVTDARGRALYFSRAVIPNRREPDDPADRFGDYQFPHHFAFAGAIEHITQRPWRDVVKLTGAEHRRLRLDSR